MPGAGSRTASRLARAIGVALLAEFSALFVADHVHAASQTRFWNLTSGTVSDFRLAPAGSNAFGANQCVNDKDGTVDHDERLVITGVAPGRYDAKLAYTTGRICFARNLEVKEGKVFSIDDHDLKDCK